jgi:hypothetical protein
MVSNIFLDTGILSHTKDVPGVTPEDVQQNADKLRNLKLPYTRYYNPEWTLAHPSADGDHRNYSDVHNRHLRMSSNSTIESDYSTMGVRTRELLQRIAFALTLTIR